MSQRVPSYNSFVLCFQQGTFSVKLSTKEWQAAGGGGGGRGRGEGKEVVDNSPSTDS